MRKSSPPSRTYSYTKIKDLQPDQKNANVFGVVLNFRPPAKSRGRDHSCSVELVDESETPVKCVLFNIDKKKLPQSCSIGDVICIKRISVSSFNDQLQLLASNFSSWILFSKESSKIVPITCSSSYTYTDGEKRRVQELRDWTLSTSLVQPGTYPPSQLPRPAISSTTASVIGSPVSVATPPGSTSCSSITSHPPSAAIVTTTGNSSPSQSPNHTTHDSNIPTQKSVDQSQATTATSQRPSGPPQGSNIPSYSESSCRPASRRHFNCRFVEIGKLVPGENKTAVCGVVKYFKPATRSRGLDYFVTVALVDPSCPSTSLSCTLFNPSKDKLPKIHCVGDIVVVKGIKTSSYQGLMQARGHEHTLIAVFDGDINIPLPLGLGDWYKLSPLESSSVLKLKKWMHDKGPLLLNTKLEETSPSHYFNTVCQVAAIAVFEPLHLAVLSIFDGTMPKSPCQNLNFSSSKYSWEIERDPCLLYSYQGLICDVFVSDLEYFDVSPGDRVSMTNVYSKSLPDTAGEDSSLPHVELNISGQGLHKGGVKVLSPDCETVANWEANLPVPHGPLPVWRNPEDMSQVKCQIIGEETLPVSSIENVYKSPIGSKLIVEVEVVNICPGPLEEMCQLRCSLCKSKYCIDVPHRRESVIDSRPLTAGDLCVYCSDSNDEGPPLEFMYVFMLQLKDLTGCLDVYVSGDNGGRLLPLVPPTNLYTDKEAGKKLLNVLYMLTGGNDPFYPFVQSSQYCHKRPVLKFCVSSYNSHKGSTCYQLVDTVINIGN